MTTAVSCGTREAAQGHLQVREHWLSPGSPDGWQPYLDLHPLLSGCRTKETYIHLHSMGGGIEFRGSVCHCFPQGPLHCPPFISSSLHLVLPPPHLPHPKKPSRCLPGSLTAGSSSLGSIGLRGPAGLSTSKE